MRTGNSVGSEEVQPCDQGEEKQRSAHPRDAGDRESHSTTVTEQDQRTEVGRTCQSKIALIPEVHLTGLTVHDGSSFSAVARLCFFFSSQPLQYVVINSSSFSPLFENKLKKAEP